MRLRSIAQVSLLVVLTCGLGGCAAPIIAGMTLGTISTIADTASSLFTGKSLEEHVLSLLTGKDCNLTESILRKDRKFCEDNGSVQTADDFKGIFAAFGGSDTDALTRYARARQQEIAEGQIASQPVQVEEASVVSFSLPIRTGVPKRGEPAGPARLGTAIVYIMAPIYQLADLVPQLPQEPHRVSHRIAVPKAKPVLAAVTAGRLTAER